MASLSSGIPTVALQAFICISRSYARHFVFVTHLSVVDLIALFNIILAPSVDQDVARIVEMR